MKKMISKSILALVFVSVFTLGAVSAPDSLFTFHSQGYSDQPGPW